MPSGTGESAEYTVDRAPSPVPPEVLAKLRLFCLGLPDVVEEPAWTGLRWTVRKKNFAQVLTIANGWPPAYARAARTPGPACVLTFRLRHAQLDSPRYTRDPFFRPVWFPDIAGLLIDARVDWDEVEALLTGSYCVLAPRKLAALVDPI